MLNSLLDFVSQNDARYLPRAWRELLGEQQCLGFASGSAAGRESTQTVPTRLPVPPEELFLGWPGFTPPVRRLTRRGPFWKARNPQGPPHCPGCALVLCRVGYPGVSYWSLGPSGNI